MNIIFCVENWNVDGTQIISRRYFTDEEDAADHCAGDYTKRYVHIQVHEKGEYNPKREARQRALAKLSPVEIELLGL